MDGPTAVLAVNGVNGDAISHPLPTAIDPQEVVDHVVNLLRINLGARDDDLRRDGSLIDSSKLPDTLQRCSRFAQDTHSALLWIQKEEVQDDFDSDTNGDSTLERRRYTYTSASSPIYSPNSIASMIIFKDAAPLVSGIPLYSQISAANLPGTRAIAALGSTQADSAGQFGAFHSVLHNLIALPFDAYIKSRDDGTKGANKTEESKFSSIASTKKNINELELSLQNLQQNIEVPTPELYLDPAIVTALQIATERHVEATLEMIPDRVDRPEFLQKLQGSVSQWITAIQNTTKYDRDPSQCTASQEIGFWTSMESALDGIEEQLRGPGVMLTLEVLKKAKRFQATVSFTADTGLKQKMEQVQNYKTLMRDFPLSMLLTAPSLPKVVDSIELIFLHVNKKFKITTYPVRRALSLVESISADLDVRIRALTNGKTLMFLEWARFQGVINDVNSVFKSWDDNIKDFTNIAREQLKRRNEKFLPIKISNRHTKIQDRIRYISTFRKNHEELQRTIVTVLGASMLRDGSNPGQINGIAQTDELGDVDASEEISEAYAALKDIDVLDTSLEGEQLWDDAEATYNEKTSRVELSIINHLRDRLATAKNANEMFHIFSKFNALFVRPKIRSAITEYQSQLIDNVKKDIDKLHGRFIAQYGHSEARAMAQLRDIPPVAGAIIWARQIRQQLDTFVGKVEDILGPEWRNHTEGQKLEQETTLFEKKLDTKPVFNTWIQEVMRNNPSISGRLFRLEKGRSTGPMFELTINFDPQVITLFKEVRHLRGMGFQINHQINTVSKDAKRVYSFAVTLIETARAFAQACRIMSEMDQVSTLLNGYRNDAIRQIGFGVQMKWESFVNLFETLGSKVRTADAGRGESRHIRFIKEFEHAIATLQTKAITLVEINAEIESGFQSLENCAYDVAAFSGAIELIQRAVDRLNLESFANLSWWVHESNARIEAILLRRLQLAIGDWLQAFSNDDAALTPVESEESEVVDELQHSSPQLTSLVHEISIRNQAISLRPPLEYARARWLEQLQAWLDVVGSLQKIKASRYEMSIEVIEQQTGGFSDLPGRCTSQLAQAHEAIDSKILAVSQYVSTWLSFQSLWDLRLEQVLEQLGEDLTQWLQLLQELVSDRNIFDTSETKKEFGQITVHYEQVQLKVNSRYDQWQQDILAKFAVLLGSKMNLVFSEVAQARKDLEGQALESSSTQQAVLFITTVQQCKRKVKFWGHQVELFRQGDTIMKRQRQQYPKGWLPMETIEGEWSALNQVLDRKSKIVDDQSDALRAKISAEDEVVRRKIEDIVSSWSSEKPVSGSIPPDEAEATLQTFELRMTKLSEEAEGVSRAKEALDLPSSQETRLAPLLEEVQDFRSVWTNLKTISDSVNELREQNWASVQVRKLRQRLLELVNMMNRMPARMRQYAAFEFTQNKLKQLQNVNNLLNDMRSDAVEDRHWEKIFKSLKSSKRYSKNMLLGDVWDLNLVAGEKIIREVLSQAQGERALKDFLTTVTTTWAEYDLDLVPYKSTCKLIRGWDDLFAKCSEHLNSLQAMRHSPYYRTFQSDAAAWEDRLNRIHILFDVWIDVQRQWVYLEGVFNGNADIKHILKTESAHFSGINRKFLEIMKQVARTPNVMEVSTMPDIQSRLEELATLLNKIQKALGEYLERERVAFPRFYFVGDEDLLEIIGNSNNTLRASKHLRKMFAGMASLITEEDDDTTIIGFMSREGERLFLRKEISIVKTPKINEWLSALDYGMKTALAALLSDAVQEYASIFAADNLDRDAFIKYVDDFPAQIVVLASQICWTNAVEQSLAHGAPASLQVPHDKIVGELQLLASTVLGDLESIKRRKCEHLITEFVHQRDTIAKLIAHEADSPTHYQWLLQMRYVYNADAESFERLYVKMANASIAYGYEYLGVQDRLVRTPLTDRCFLTLTQALCQRLGGSPYGPAGTGKTESVKALGLQLGRFTLVFCCDDTFDFQAMGRIFLGICKVGAWGCFDEFNRLEERILSAVSQQIQNIQTGLRRAVKDAKAEIELVGRSLQVSPNTGIFITMNPGYAGRSNLPDNLKKLFRSVAMSKPDKELIAEVMLYSQGFSCAKALSKQTVPFFDSCDARLSKQQHYDFGLRALKSVLVSSGGLKRARLTSSQEDNTTSDQVVEPQIIVQSIRETIAPKLIRSDVEIMLEIEQKSFPGVEYIPLPLTDLREAIQSEATSMKLVAPDSWMTKVLQLYQIQELHHGVMMVGSSGSGKSSAWRVLLRALSKVSNIESIFHVIDPKVMSKDNLYGTLDSTTREWTDGLFTSILRKIVDNLRGEDNKRHWLVFDGDVDPIWVENLNSVLDDNKMLTLPNGERLIIPQNVRILFEVENLRYATLATVSRCGMVWFSDDTVSNDMILKNFFSSLRGVAQDVEGTSQPAQNLATQVQIADHLEQLLLEGDFVHRALDEAKALTHIMQFTDIRALNTLFSLLNQTCRDILEWDVMHSDFPLDKDQIEAYLSKKLLLSLVWSLAGDCPITERKVFGDLVTRLTSVEAPSLVAAASLIDFDVSLPQGQWKEWASSVASIDIDTNQVTDTEIVIPTLDTVRHEAILHSWLTEHKPLILCGPPGSGKTMTLFNALKKSEHMDVVGLNFSSATTPDLLVKTFEQYCEYRKTLAGPVLQPTQVGRWLVVFCDEINLPAPDQYGTPRAISFLRQLVEQNGFWRPSDKAWVTLDRIQFVGACNPPTDPGRTPLGLRFLRHAPVIMVDYPGEVSLQQIYGTFNSAVLKLQSNMRGYAEPLTKAMVQVYIESQQRFTPDIQPHYVYSPRELSRWVRGLYETIHNYDTLDLEGLVRIWAHEALRLFQDRLVSESERKWTEEAIHRIALEHFPTIDEDRALGGPILFSNWLTKRYESVDRESLREMVSERLKAFGDEEVDVRLVPFNDLLEHVLRIDRVFRQSQGHLILIGVSGSGKTTLSRFVAWMNGLSVYQIKIHRRYSAEDFDEDLRIVLRRCGCKGEKICFIMDESNVLDSGFLERMNTLLANAEVPGLFEGDEYTALMNQCREAASQREGGKVLDSAEDLYKWFKGQIAKNLHVVFTMNPPEEGLSNKAATSPALFNRCVLNWFGDWSDQALFQVGSELTKTVDMDRERFDAPQTMPIAYRDLPLPATHRNAIINAMVHVHHSLADFNIRLKQQQDKITFLTPRHFLDFVDHFVKLHEEKRNELEDEQRHLNIGLDKISATFEKVRALKADLAEKNKSLSSKQREAEDKMTKMVAGRSEAQQSRGTALEVQRALEKQSIYIEERRAEVQRDLADAEPKVLEAKEAVHNVKRQNLDEVRSLPRPPAIIKFAMEAVCTLLTGQKTADWKEITGLMRRPEFIGSIVNFDTERKMNHHVLATMKRDYLSNPDFNEAKVMQASKGVGPLAIWVRAQCEFFDVLEKVGPMREEVAELEQQKEQQEFENKIIQDKLQKLEQMIEQYSHEYGTLIGEMQKIETETKLVTSKVERSERLLASLSSEKVRWEQGSSSFATQIDTLVGDTLVAAAMLAYGGFYDQQYRKAMLDDWNHHLAQSNIKYKEHNPITEYLSTADDRLQWQRNSLPVDDLCTENAIMLKRYNRYPLIIDPSGRVTEFLQNEYKHTKLAVTSFLDSGFTKQLESSLRFGTPILIQDAEHIDPILTHVLNKEHQRTGGRVLIQLGKQDIDFSRDFKMFLTTRDPSHTFAPDICSRITMVNFTVTQSSLQTQSLNDVLKSERPDVDERRSNVIKLQGEFNVRLRKLEKDLLQALNESQGNILDDDNVLNNLERLKKEAAEISAKAAETEGVWVEVETITQQYKVIAKSCSAIFAVLDHLHRLNHFYQFPLQYFTDIFSSVLKLAKKSSEPAVNARIDFIIRQLFLSTFRRTSLAMLQKDKVTLAMLLAQASPYSMNRALIDDCLKEDTNGIDVSSEPSRREEAMARALKMSSLKGHLQELDASTLDQFMNAELAERHVPTFSGAVSAIDQALLAILAVKTFRADRFVPAVESFVTTVFGAEIFSNASDLAEVVQQVSSTVPIALSSSPGFDASFKVDQLVERSNVTCNNIAMGSSEGVASADKAIANAAANGSWVLIKNVHLAPTWLQSLEKRIQSLKPNPDFRLFLSMETSPKIPVNLLRASRIVMNEQPAGIRANMKESLSSLAIRATKQPVERARVYLLLALLHAIVQERLRYAPQLGWRGFWEFNDSDYECCAHIIDTWVESISDNRTNINPKNIPWPMLRTLIIEMYGGKIDNEADFAILSILVNDVITPLAFEHDFDIVKDLQTHLQGQAADRLLLPSGTGWREFLDWVEALPEREPPTYLGLPGNAEKLLLRASADEMAGKLRMIVDILDEGSSGLSDEGVDMKD